VTSRLCILHNPSVASRSPEGERFTDPRGATLNRFVVPLEFAAQFSGTYIYLTYIAVKEIRSPTRGRLLNIDTGSVEEYVRREWTPRAARRRR